jgi:hypothetical protein
MEQYEALTNVIRALSKKCEDYERFKSNSETYYRWYEKEKEGREALLEQIDKLEREIAERS